MHMHTVVCRSPQAFRGKPTTSPNQEGLFLINPSSSTVSLLSCTRASDLTQAVWKLQVAMTLCTH